MGIIEWLQDEPVVASIGWTLIHFVWQGFLIALVLRFMLRMTARKDANTRYLVSSAAMLALVVAPVITFLSVHDGPGNGVLAITEGRGESAGDPGAYGVGPSVGSDAASVGSGAGSVRSDASADQSRATGLRSNARAGTSTRELEGTWSATFDLPDRVTAYLHTAIPWLVAAWLFGVILFSARMTVGWCYAQSLRRRMVSPVEDALLHRFELLRERIGINRSVRVLQSALVGVPSVIGYLKPVVLIPASALAGLSTEQLDAILAHELAHIRRHDHLVNFVQTIAEAVLFYHPAVWWISDQIRSERENCCDDVAVSVSGSLRTYVMALTHLEERRAVTAGFALAATDASLLARVKRLLDVSSDASSDRQSWAGGLATCLLIAAVLIGAASPDPEMAGRDADELAFTETSSKVEMALAGPNAWLRAPRQSSDPQIARPGPERASVARTTDGSEESALPQGEPVEVNPEPDTLDDDKVVQALIGALEGAEVEMRAQIANALGMRESPAAIGALSELLASDEDENVRQAAAWALGMIEDSRAVSALTSAISRPGETEGVLSQVIWALGMIEDDGAVDILVDALGDDRPALRSQAAWALGMIEDDRAVDALMDVLEDGGREVRIQAVWALGMIESPRAVTALIERFRAEQDPEIRLTIAHALGMIGDERAVEVLADAINSDDPELRKAAISALGMMDGPNPNRNLNPKPNLNLNMRPKVQVNQAPSPKPDTDRE